MSLNYDDSNSLEMSTNYDDTNSFDMSAKDDNPNELLPTTQPCLVDVGVHAWTTLFGAWLAIAATFGYTFTFGIYQDVYARADVASATGVRWIGATQLSVLLATSLPAGLLHDSGHFRSVVTLGSYLFTFSYVRSSYRKLCTLFTAGGHGRLFMLSLIDLKDHYLKFFFTQGIVMGVAAGLVCIPSLAVQAHHWGPRSTLAMGIASTGLFFGGTFFTIMLNQLLQHGVSFAWTVRVSSFVVLGMLLVANTCMRRSCPRVEPLKGDKRASMRELVTDAPFMCVAIGGLFMNWGIYFVFSYLQQYVIDAGMNRAFAVYTPAILCGAAVLGGILSNLVATKYGTINAFTYTALPCTILILMVIPTSISGVAVLATISGFPTGAWLSLLPPALRTTSTSTRDCGVRLGLGFAMSAVAVPAGTLVNNWLLGPAPQFEWGLPAMLVMGAGVLLCVTAQYIMRHDC
ncbi:MFS general substrate transporter [Auriscalpium vulgare]|uniref:MFS general substrate transporter n=1 Tax=Auriscalpium vulgare TaxID=40419 RepID=A0ACB8RHB2_9AGAM|nr:MFS general substrate transporter [Auriscalpium vulgare]